MKKAIKKILEAMGIWATIKKLAGKFGMDPSMKIPKKYQKIDRWYLKHRNLNLEFDTSEWYSKKWFFPRYDDGRIHEPTATDIFIDHINSDSTVLDLGGHLGYFSCIAGKLANNGSVHVFEVDPQCLSLIHKNTKLNGLDNVLIHNYAVSDAQEIVRIPQYEYPNPSLIINSTNSANFIEIESAVIDDFLAQTKINPDFIKIDIEGAEWKALSGMKNTLNHTNATLLVEVHVENLSKNFDTDYKQVIKLLLDYGYTLKEIEYQSTNGSAAIIDLETKLEGNRMILCTKTS